MVIESPKYKILSKNESYEIRHYEPYILAQIKIEADYETALNEGFRILASYIFGDNRNKAHIAMTIPVTEEPAGVSQKISMTRPVTSTALEQGRYLISFTMPQKYTIESLPEPNNKSILIKPIAAHNAAAVRFRGRLNEELFQRKDKQLRSALERDGIKTKSNSVAAQYDPPFVPRIFRKNEILIEI